MRGAASTRIDVQLVSLEDRVPQEHPLRAIRRITDRALERLSPRFGRSISISAARRFARETAARAAAAGPGTIRSERQ